MLLQLMWWYELMSMMNKKIHHLKHICMQYFIILLSVFIIKIFRSFHIISPYSWHISIFIITQAVMIYLTAFLIIFVFITSSGNDNHHHFHHRLLLLYYYYYLLCFLFMLMMEMMILKWIRRCTNKINIK